MFFQFLLSVFGFALLFRILSLVEKNEVISLTIFNISYVFLHLPLLFNLIFKELIVLNIIYIGIILIILILSDKIFQKHRQISFEKLHLDIIQRILLQLACGNSFRSSLQLVWSEFSAHERKVFSTLYTLLTETTPPTPQLSAEETFFYAELAKLLIESSHVSEQMMSLRRILSLQHKLRHRSRVCLVQTRAQTISCALIYVLILILSCNFLNLKLLSSLVGLATLVQAAGLYIVFNAHKGFKWKT